MFISIIKKADILTVIVLITSYKLGMSFSKKIDSISLLQG